MTKIVMMLSMMIMLMAIYSGDDNHDDRCGDCEDNYHHHRYVNIDYDGGSGKVAIL